MRVFTFVTNTLFEERVLQRAQEKRQAEAKVIRAGKFNTKSTENERKEFLVSALALHSVQLIRTHATLCLPLSSLGLV